MTEKQLQNAILREFGTRPDMRLWRASAGAARIGRRFIRFGVPGQADLTGIITVGGIGVSLWIEVKSPTGRQGQEQMWFQQIVSKLGGLYVLARSVTDVENGIEAFKQRCRPLLAKGLQDRQLLGMDRSPR
jgi:hypothetical protein